MIFQLIYSSVATSPFWPNDLFALVEKSRQNNAPRGITGMLLYNDGQFLQLLEGPEAAVRACLAIVARDPRHESIAVLSSEMRPERDFPGWTMGFEQPEDAWTLPRAWVTVGETRFGSDSPFTTAAEAKEIFLAFKLAARESAPAVP